MNLIERLTDFFTIAIMLLSRYYFYVIFMFCGVFCNVEYKRMLISFLLYAVILCNSMRNITVYEIEFAWKHMCICVSVCVTLMFVRKSFAINLSSFLLLLHLLKGQWHFLLRLTDLIHYQSEEPFVQEKGENYVFFSNRWICIFKIR